MQFIWLVNSWLPHIPQIMLSSGLFNISRALCFMIFTTQLHPCWFLEPTLMLIGPVNLVTIPPPLLVLYFSWRQPVLHWSWISYSCWYYFWDIVASLASCWFRDISVFTNWSLLWQSHSHSNCPHWCFYEQTKDIEIDCHFIHHHLLRGELHLISIGTLDQPTDLFTKPHSPRRFRTLVSKLKLVTAPPTWVWGGCYDILVLSH